MKVFGDLIGFEFGIIKDYPETIINYIGDGESGVKIKIEALYGSASSLRINNTTRSEYIILDDTKLSAIVGSGIEKYDEITIDTTRGNKSAKLLRNGVTKNILNAVDISSKWIQLQKGSNKFTATANGLSNLVITIEYTNRLLGV